MEEADRLLVIGGNLFPYHGRILPGDIDNADKDIGVIAVHKECLRKEFQLFQDEIQNVRTRLITPVIVEQMKIVDIRHQKGVLFFFASVIEKRKNFFFRICNPFSLRNFFKKVLRGRMHFCVSYFGGIMYNGNETSVTNYDMGKGRENNET